MLGDREWLMGRIYGECYKVVQRFMGKNLKDGSSFD
jgi:hypothetical protein